MHCLLSWCYCIGMPLLTYQAGQVHCCLFDIMDSLNLFDNFFFLSKIQVVKIFGMLCIKKKNTNNEVFLEKFCLIFV